MNINDINIININDISKSRNRDFFSRKLEKGEGHDVSYRG